ncbi:leucyl aminopeptidase family protein [Pleionea sp. CnH1-48]|uniref:M17 family metallopeptidase n=1 Tax=Pleionea sp. CnH1-48 TaxID=2954494 RepID=UPI0020972D67|nr:leucyl aminopeptidase family protein [Pleionea sp. CnH1-48]MCO7225389.1 leucyl aminopeptidase family protein [Pleionea sp. CnH1-48]
MAFPLATAESDITQAYADSTQYDAVIIVSPDANLSLDANLQSILQETQKVDQRLGNSCVVIHHPKVAGGRLIHSSCGDLTRDFDDVRQVGDATRQAILEARAAGVTKPLLIIDGLPQSPAYDNALEVAYLSACQALWQPLEAREALDENLEPISHIALLSQKPLNTDFLNGLESGKRLARDLCGTEPERMAPPRFADMCAEALAGSSVKVDVIDDQPRIEKDYPLLAAVARASQSVTRHQPRVIHFEYEGKGPIKQTLFLVGKAVTYDTGGADIKVGGHMAGMSRDKGGGAAVAGFMKMLAELQPEGIKVVASIGAVRNSIGTDCYVADEIIKSHAGLRVRIGNTDAEGRLVMVDLLSHLREQAVKETNPQLFTVATLTGHAALAAGPYTILIENEQARSQHLAAQLSTQGDQWGDCIEISRPRREDWHTVRPRSKADDILSSNNGPSVSIARGHQFPMAFLSAASGLDKHGIHSGKPIAYTHVDIAGSGVESGNWQHDTPTAAPITALAAHYLK